MERAMSSDDLVDMGEAHHQAGRLQEAEACYRKAIDIDPGHPGALYFLANIAYDDGRWPFATQLIEELLRDEPNDAEAWHLLGMTALMEGDFSKAVNSLNKALTIQPAYVQAHYNLGDVLGRQGDIDGALTSFQRAAALRPQFADAHFAIGNVYRAQSKFDQAMASYRLAVAAQPNFELAHLNMGMVFLSQEKLDEAITTYRHVLELNPNSPAGYCYLGVAFMNKKRNADAELNLRRAIALDSNYAEAYGNLGLLLLAQGNFSEGAIALQRAAALMPNNPRALRYILEAFNNSGKLIETIECLKEIIALDPNWVEARSSLLANIQYLPDYSREQIFSDHVAFGEYFETPLRKNWPQHAKPVNARKRLRVGFVSGDLLSHPVGYFLEGVLRELHRRDGIDIIVYSTNSKEDALTDRLRATTHAWSSVAALSDEDFEQRIRSDNIDILIDLSGHTTFNRLMVFARKSAPIQVTWLGYWETTGLRAIDYILCDRHLIRDGEEKFFVEQPWYLPNTRLCFTPPNVSIAVSVLPALSAGYVTFGCFNNLFKMTDRVVAVWASILTRIPNSRLMLKSSSFRDSTVKESVATRFAAHGVAAERLLLEQDSPLYEYFSAYNRVDIALDPFPFPGGTTSFEGVWMGVPMVTMRGDRIISRQGESILHNIGLQDWIAADEDAYVELAVRHAGDLASLATLRGQLREKLETSPLCDAKLFARHLEEAFKQMWNKSCQSF